MTKHCPLPDHKFLPWQQEAYNAIMSGKNFHLVLGTASGKTYLRKAIESDLKLLADFLDEIDQNNCN